MSNAHVYEKITARVLEQLAAGTVPWHKPWSGGTRQRPRNLVSRKPYHGVNIFVTACQGYTSPYWLTINQLKQLGGCDRSRFCRKKHEHAHVRKGETGTPIVFWSSREVVRQAAGEPEPHTDRIFLARYSHVWNVAQVTGIDGKVPVDEAIVEREFSPIEECERIVRGLVDAPTIEHRIDQRAYYQANVDRIVIPRPETFESAEDYYATLFHELAHATGHPKRLNRETLVDRTAFGDTNYSEEELVAEFAATFLCGVAGIENRVVDNSAAYLASWSRKLESDKHLVLRAASKAQRAADHLLGVVPDAVAAEDATPEEAATA